jgi:diguanylate cyclase (GGDEF)-like protein/PAS domain S-box-containing protein
VLDCDDAFTLMFGYTAEELIGKSVLDHIHPEDQGRAVEGWVNMLSTRRIQQTRLRRQRKDGTWMWVDLTLHNFLHQPGRNHVLVEIIDCSAEMAAQEALAEREEVLRRLTEAMPLGLLQVDLNQEVVYHNARLARILRTDLSPSTTDPVAAPDGETDPQSSESRKTLSLLLSTLTPECLAAVEDALGRVLDNGVDEDLELDFAPRRGTLRRCLMTVRALNRSDSSIGGAIACVLDITDSARARRELEDRATFDQLTRCYNRASIITALERALEQDPRDLTIFYLDLDDFKHVNDTMGHSAGDEVLIATTARIRDAIRSDDTIGRLGGDEFLVLCRRKLEHVEAVQLAARMTKALSAQPVPVEGASVSLRASIGFATAGSDMTTAADLIRRADADMYESKRRSRDAP